MASIRPITIVGGGLAGLALGAALTRAGIDVTLCEAGRLPRPRVCGEFISGLTPATIAKLGLAPHLQGAMMNRTTGWYAGGRLRWATELPEPALGISRNLLEERLLENFVTNGGKVQLNFRVQEDNNAPGLIWASGRQADSASPWLGLKIHCRNLTLAHDLELHLGRGGYIGAARIEDGRVNICGLFRIRPELRGPREKLLPAYIDACGLREFAARVSQGDPDPASAAAVSGLDFTRAQPRSNRVALGDQLAAIPPYTGHGMAMALEQSAATLEPLLGYARNEKNWMDASNEIRAALSTRCQARLRWARILHPWLLHPLKQSLLLALADIRLLPFKFFYRATHQEPIAVQ